MLNINAKVYTTCGNSGMITGRHYPTPHHDFMYIVSLDFPRVYVDNFVETSGVFYESCLSNEETKEYVERIQDILNDWL